MTKQMDVFGLDDPVALITGAVPDRIGWCVAETLARRGYRLALHARTSFDEVKNASKRLRKSGNDARAFAADIRDEEQVEKLIEDVYDRFERIDVLVNCAAIWKSLAFENLVADDMREHWETNTLGTFLCCQKVGRIMIGQPMGGAIVNLGDWGTDLPYLGCVPYFASKGAIPALTRALAVELADRNRGIRVNAVLPGPVTLPVDMDQDEREASISSTLVQREGTPQHVADAVAALIENDHITGVCLPVDGGRGIKKN